MASSILQQYKILVEFLGKVLGPDYEIVLQDLSSNSIVAIANNQISGRSIGSPLTNTALQMLSSKSYEKSNYLCNYKGITEECHTLRSSTMFIKDDNGTPIGLLCINFDDSRYTELMQNLRSIIHPSTFNSERIEPDKPLTISSEEKLSLSSSITENFPMDIPTLMQRIFEEATADLLTPIDRLNQTERKEVVKKLNEQGIFQLKGAIPFVAKKFSCSTATIYRYLNEITSLQ